MLWNDRLGFTAQQREQIQIINRGFTGTEVKHGKAGGTGNTIVEISWLSF